MRLLVDKAETFPEGIPGAFQRLEARLPAPRGRKLYGVARAAGCAMEYHAGVVAEDDGEGARLGLPEMTIPAGPYARTTLMQWEERKAEIPAIVDFMIESVDHDPSRPVLELYSTSFELQVLVPVGG